MLAHNGKRLTTRITNHVQEKLKMAADLVGGTINQFVVQAALEKAEKIIESASTIVLTRRESMRLLELVENPPPRNEKFLQAMRGVSEILCVRRVETIPHQIRLTAFYRTERIKRSSYRIAN